jgi:hypothetical protein
MTAEALLSRLDKVKQTGKDSWVACCPAHADQHPSLNVRELPDGTVLIKCFTGCGAADVVAAVGLDLSDLFPPRPDSPDEPTRRQAREGFHAMDVLVALAHEALVVDCAVGTLQRRGWLTDEECDRLAQASDRIRGGLAYASRRYVG